MTINLDTHKYQVMLAQKRRDEKSPPKLTQVINR